MASVRSMPRSSSSSKRASSVFEGENTRSREYWNNLMCVFTGLNPDESKPAGVTSICNRDYFNDQPSPPRTPVLRTRSSKNSVAGSSRSSFLRPSFSHRRSSRSLLKRISTLGSGVDYEIQEESVPQDLSPNLSPVASRTVEPVLEEEEVSTSFFEDSILGTVPGAPSGQQEMISLEHEGRTIWLPRHVLSMYSSAPQRPGSAGRLTISIPDRTASKPIKQTTAEGQSLTLVETASSQAPSEKSFNSSSPSGSHRSKDSLSGSSIDGATLDTPGSVYSSDGTSLTSLELQTPVDSTAPHAGHSKNYSVADPLQAGVFDDASSPPPVQPRNPRRAAATLPLPTFDSREFVAKSPIANELYIVDADSPTQVKRITETPAVPQRSQRRGAAEAKKQPPLAAVSEHSASPARTNASVSSDAAERVVFHLLLAARSLPDLFALSSINSGFRAVYTRSQLALVKNALHNACIPAWELREASNEDAAPAATQAERARAWLGALKRDAEALADLKSALADACASFLRPDTLAALRGDFDPADTDAAETEHEIDAALWRIWTFCTLFASSPTALPAQTAWLRAPARNAGTPLSAAQLYTMTELWTAIGALLSHALLSCSDALSAARGAGVVPPDADHGALEAWLDAQRARGPAVALELASVATEPSAEVFAFAAQMGWAATDADREMRAFLKEALGVVYCERLAAERGSRSEILAPTPVSPGRNSAVSMMEDAQFAVAGAQAQAHVQGIDERFIHPALRREVEEEEGFVTPPDVLSSASSAYSTRPVTPA